MNRRKTIILIQLLISCCLLPINTIAQNNLVWATYYGGMAFDRCNGIAVDVSGNVYMTGETESYSGIASGGFKTTYSGGNFDGDTYLVKFNAKGNRLWATYYGGTQDDLCSSVAVDASGNVYIAGTTSSTSGIASLGAFQNNYGGGATDAYLVKFDANGNRLWATYYGGSQDDRGFAVKVDASGNIYLSGSTNSAAGIAFGGFQNSFNGGLSDAFLVKFDANGNRLWATYFGGSGKDSYEVYANNIAIDNSNNIYLTGSTLGSILPGITPSAFQSSNAGMMDAFLVKFNSAGNYLWGTYYGGASHDIGTGIATDASGNIYMAGMTESNTGLASTGGFQNVNAGAPDVFLAKFNSSGNRLWGTYFGGAITDEMLIGVSGGVVTDTKGDVYLAAVSHVDGTSKGGQLAVNGFQDSLLGAENSILAKFDSTGNLLCATYYGKSQDEEIATLASDASNNIYLGGHTLFGFASGGFQNTHSGGTYEDAILIKFTSCGSNTASTNILCNGNCDGTATVFPVGGAPYSYLWNSAPAQTTQTATGLCAGNYTVVVTDAFAATFSYSVAITSPPALSATSTFTNISCAGSNDGSAGILASGGTGAYFYSWSQGSNSTSINNLSPQNYNVTITDINNCILTQTIVITEPGALTAITSFTPATCSQNDGIAAVTVTGGTSPYNYSWSSHGTNIPFPNSNPSSNLFANTYTVLVTDARGCTKTAALHLNNLNAPAVSIFSFTNASCYGASDGSAIVSVIGGIVPYSYSWDFDPTQTTFQATGLSAGNYLVKVTDANDCISATNVDIFEPLAITIFLDSANSVLKVNCNGNTTGKAKAIAFGGLGSLSYSWNTNPVQLTDSIINLTAEEYVLTVTDASSCTQTLTVTITEPSPINASIISNANCVNSNGTAVATVTGGTAPYSCSWSPIISNTFSVSGLSDGTYSCKITDALGCIATVSVSAIQNLTISPAPNVTVYAGESVTIAVNGNSSNAIYEWVPTIGLECPSCSSTIVRPDNSIRYCVQVTDTITQCSSNACITVFVKVICSLPYVPTAFSPNDDKKNDVLFVQSNCIDNLLFSIYGRWGEKIFETNDTTKGWDGTYKDKKLDPGVFVYYLQAIVNGESIIQHGNVTLTK